MKPILWRCPYCNHNATIREGDIHRENIMLQIDNKDGYRDLECFFVVCPNPECNKFILKIGLFNLLKGVTWVRGSLINKWSLIPPSKAKPFPDYIPEPIREDYNEACLICELSPKASATLSRRCLQGIIRDFWEVKPGRLFDEIEQIKDKVDYLTWEAIDSVRKVGNIGAHMEEDINIIVEVEPKEAELLIGLIETLLKNWYIATDESKKNLEEIKKIAKKKEIKKKAPSPHAQADRKG